MSSDWILGEFLNQSYWQENPVSWLAQAQIFRPIIGKVMMLTWLGDANLS